MPYTGYLDNSQPQSQIDPRTGLPVRFGGAMPQAGPALPPVMQAPTQPAPQAMPQPGLPPVASPMPGLPEPPDIGGMPVSGLPPVPSMQPSIPRVPQTPTPERDALAYELANPPKPKLWQRLAAGAVGGLAGAVNASGRTRIDPRVTEGATRDILMGGYDQRLARQGQLAGLERQSEQDAEDARMKQAQMDAMGETFQLKKSQLEATNAARQNMALDRERNDYLAMHQMGGEIIEPGGTVKPGYEIAPFTIGGKQVQVPTGATARKLAKTAEIEANSVPTSPILAKWFKSETGQDLKPTLTKAENDQLTKLYDTSTRLAATKSEGEANRTLRKELGSLAASVAQGRKSASEDAALDKVVTMLGKRFEKQTGAEIQAANLHKRIIDSSIESISRDPKSSGAAKFAILYNFVKLLDNNAVREGEVKAVQDAMPLRDRAKVLIDKGIGYGGNIDDAFARQIAEQARVIWQGYQSNYAANVRQAVALAREQGISDKKISLIINRPFSEVQDLLKEPSPDSSAKPALPAGFKLDR